MLEITIDEKEYFNELTDEFIYSPSCTLQLEHSLYSMYEWESKYKKPFMSKEPRTYEETVDYIRMMTLNKPIDDLVYRSISQQDISKIVTYMEDPMTATTFKDNNRPKGNNGSYLSAEVIYYYMTALNIPFECQYWHLNKLMTLIRVCNEKQQPPKKMGKRALMERNTKLNAQRRAALKSRG